MNDETLGVFTATRGNWTENVVSQMNTVSSPLQMASYTSINPVLNTFYNVV
jgi:hypothetical protein